MKTKVSNSDNNSKEFFHYFLFKKLMRNVSFTMFTYQLMGKQEINRILIFREVLIKYFYTTITNVTLIFGHKLCAKLGSKSLVTCAAYFSNFNFKLW